ncbi:MAG: aminotransferase class III-fold pyridoxal phosphate-dependent enzyme [Planctomycetota bacterium]|jgi:4-aminobutyrate aminotransferase-like enzyme
MTTPTTDKLTAEAFTESPAVVAAVDTITRELIEAQALITEARPPATGRAEDYAQYLDRLANVRGKGALYPYLGSGFGHGALVELADGSVKWDMINGIGVHGFGHGDAELVAAAVRAAMSDVVMQGNLQCNTDALAFAELLIDQASRTSELRHCFLTNSGTMANESALKICMQRKDGKAARVLAFADAFMGRSTTMVRIGDTPTGRVGLPMNALVDYMPFYDPEHGERSIQYAVYHLDQYFRRYPGQHACFVMELVQGEGGFNVAPREFFVALMEICRRHDVPVWIDEVQSFGRTESMFYFEQLDLGEYIDVVTVGKLSQVCACLYTEAMNPKPGLLSGTFIGSTVGLQVGRRALERLRDGGYYGREGRIAELQRAFREHAQAMVEKHPDWFSPVPHPSGLERVATGFFGGVGGMMRLTPFGGERQPIVDALFAMFEDGVIAFYCGHGPYHLRFLAPVGVHIFNIIEGALARAVAPA